MFGHLCITEVGSHGQHDAGKLMLHRVGAFALKSILALLLQGKQQRWSVKEGPGMAAEEFLELVKHYLFPRERRLMDWIYCV